MVDKRRTSSFATPSREQERPENTTCKTCWNPQAKTRARLEPRRSQKRESTQLLPGLVEEVASTVPVESGSASSQ